jgi:predicted ArsR family transcriptional regulator
MIMTPQQTTRNRILNYLDRRHTATAAEISRALHLTCANIRHHLNILHQEGVVKIRTSRHLASRGRPELVYGLAVQASKHNLHTLSDILLKILLQEKSNDEVKAILLNIADNLLAAQDKAPQLNPSFSVRLFNCTTILNSMNYDFRWEAHAQAPLLIFGHCPYAAILNQHPELCKLDASLLEVLLGMPVDQFAYLESTQSGIPQCVFQIEIRSTLHHEAEILKHQQQ